MKTIGLTFILSIMIYSTSSHAVPIQIANQVYDDYYGDKSKVNLYVQIYDDNNVLCFPNKNESFILKFGKVLNFDTDETKTPCKTVGKILMMNTSTKDYYQGGIIIPFCEEYMPYIYQIMIGRNDYGPDVQLDKDGNILQPGNMEIRELWQTNSFCQKKVRYITSSEATYYRIRKQF